jgi:hypothetical protein
LLGLLAEIRLTVTPGTAILRILFISARRRNEYAAIGEYYKKLFANPQFVPFTLTLNWNSFPGWATSRLRPRSAKVTVTRNGKQIHFRGNNLLVWKKQVDGSWKIFRYMFNEIPAKK